MRFGTDPVTLLEPALVELTRANLVSIDEQSIRLTPNGYFLANEVCVRLISALDAELVTHEPAATT